MSTLSQVEQKLHKLTATVGGQRLTQPITALISGSGEYKANLSIAREFSRLFVILDGAPVEAAIEEEKATIGDGEKPAAAEVEKPRGPGRPSVKPAGPSTIGLTIFGLCDDRRVPLVSQSKHGDGAVIELPYCPTSIRIEIEAVAGQSYSILAH